MTALLTVENLVVDYGRGRKAFRAVDGVDLEIEAGETLGLVGESGSGKSTIAKVLVGLESATSGRVLFDGTDITKISRAGRRNLASSIQMVFQDPYSSLNPAKTIGQALAEPFIRQSSTSSGDRRRRIAVMLDRVGMSEKAIHQYPSHLSGGQRQRIAIARALMLEPRLVVCDEPVSALDLSIQAQILNLLAEIQEDMGVSYLFVAHNLSVVRHISHRVAVLYRGQVMEQGDIERTYVDPSHPYTRALLSAEPVSDPGLQSRRRDSRLLEVQAAGPTTEGGCVFAARCAHATTECTQARPPLETLDDGQESACIRHHELAKFAITT